METGPSVCANGVNIQNVNKKELLIQRIKNQQSILNVLERRYSEANKQQNALLEKIKEKTIDSEKIICSLRFRILQNEKELRNCLFPSNSSQQSVSSPSLKVTPAPSSLLNTNLLVPPPALLPATASIPTVTSSSTLKRPLSAIGSSASSPIDFTQMPVDPAVELVLNRFLHSLHSSEAQIASNRAELQCCKFTEDSQNGKRMMSRLRVLERENAELEAIRESGRRAKVANLMALRRRHLARLHRENARSEKLLDDVESEVEVFTNALMMLQQQLTIAHATIEVLVIALANSDSHETSSSSTSSKSTVRSPAAQKCIELLRSADWPLPASLRDDPASELADVDSCNS